MGYVRHHAIVVTAGGDRIAEAHAKAREIFADIAEVTEITPEATNGYRSFLVAPDGSKEWWNTSDRGDDLRETYADWLREHGHARWVEVQYGDDEDQNHVVNGSGIYR